jgi:tartrate-resistant acid phosphatase type 5
VRATRCGPARMTALVVLLVAACAHARTQAPPTLPGAPDFGLLLGDNFYPDGVVSADDPHWVSKFEHPYADLLAAGIAFYPVLGNHDYADGNDFSRGAHQVAYAVAHPLWRMSAAHYTFEAGDATFVALDTQRIVSNEGDSIDSQRAMVSAALDGHPRPWVIAFGHHPYVSNGTNGNAGRRLGGFMEERLCRKADLYLAGHEHNLQLLAAPARGPCRWLSVVAGGGPNPAFFQSQTLGFAYATLEPGRLVVQLYDADGVLLFTKELTR